MPSSTITINPDVYSPVAVDADVNFLLTNEGVSDIEIVFVLGGGGIPAPTVKGHTLTRVSRGIQRSTSIPSGDVYAKVKGAAGVEQEVVVTIG